MRGKRGKMNKLSTNYLLNRYSYILYFIFVLVIFIYLRNIRWTIDVNIIIFFLIGTSIFFLWIFIYGSFHFSRQAEIERIDYQTLKIRKGFFTELITDKDIKRVKFYFLINYKMRSANYKVLLETTKGEFIGFTYRIPGANQISIDCDVLQFFHDTENFWNMATLDKIERANNIFECN